MALTTVHLPIREIGEQAGRQLLARLGAGSAAAPVALPVRLMERASTGPVPR